MIKLKTTLSITLAFISFICFAQEKMSIERLYFTGGKNIGSFSFKTSSGEKDKNLQWKMGNALGASMGIKLFEKQTIKAGLLYYETGSGSSFLEEKIEELDFELQTYSSFKNFFNHSNDLMCISNLEGYFVHVQSFQRCTWIYRK